MSLGDYFSANQDILSNGIDVVEWILYWEDELKIERFIIVQAVGNNKADSTSAALFASITDESIEYLQEIKMMQTVIF